MERKLKEEKNEVENQLSQIDQRLTICEARNADNVKSQDMIVRVYEKDIQAIKKALEIQGEMIGKLKGDCTVTTYLFYTLPTAIALFCCIIVLVYLILWFK